MSSPTQPRHRRNYMAAALVMGSALSALGPSGVQAAPGAVQDLTRYCNACWRNARLQPDAWPDCTQEVFRRLLERVTPDSWDKILATEADERREFLRAIDAVKKRTQRAHRSSSLSGEVVDRLEPQQRDLADRRQTVLAAAFRCLNPRQAEIVSLTLDGWSVRAIAERLDLSSARVSDEKYKAIRRLQRELV